MIILRNIHHNLLSFHPVRTKLLSGYVRCKSYLTETAFPETSVQIKTCGSLYRKWKEDKLYKELPEGDLTFNVPFIDTRFDESEMSRTDRPTVLALSGAPGSWRDFISLSSYLHHNGCRVITPSFPDFHVCKPGIFRHSAVEKAQYVKDFLTAISVSRVDLLVCHSSATYCGLNLCLDEEPKIKSLALLNPATFSLYGMSSTKNFAFLKLFVKLGENPSYLNFLEIVGPFFLKNVVKVPVRFHSVLDPLLSATTMMRGNIVESKEKFQLVSQKLPIFYVFSENDPLISAKPSYELAELLGARMSDIFVYSDEGQLKQKGVAKPTLKVLCFQQGSHYAFIKHSKLINEEIVEFLKNQKLL